MIEVQVLDGLHAGSHQVEPPGPGYLSHLFVIDGEVVPVVSTDEVPDAVKLHDGYELPAESWVYERVPESPDTGPVFRLLVPGQL